MNTSYSLNAYKSHDLNISMKTSSGDVIKMNFANESSLSANSQKDSNGSKTELSFSSMQSFNFSIKSDGIDEQDKKEIEEFMKIAQPHIDGFLKELGEDAPASPVTKLAQKVASIFDPNRPRSDDEKGYIKSKMVDLFDSSLQKIKEPEVAKNIFQDVKTLLERTLKAFDEFNKNIYA